MEKKKTVYLELIHPSGKKTVKKWNTQHTSKRKIKNEFYASTYHFNTEAGLHKIKKKK